MPEAGRLATDRDFRCADTQTGLSNPTVVRLSAALVAVLLCATACGRKQAAVPYAERARRADQFVIPAGSTISIRVVTRIDATKAIPAEGFAAVITGNASEAVISGSPARLVILPGQLGLGAVMIGGSWLPASAPLGTLVQGVIDTRIAQPPGSDESMAIRTSGDRIQVPAGTLLIFRNSEAITIGSPQQTGGN